MEAFCHLAMPRNSVLRCTLRTIACTMTERDCCLTQLVTYCHLTCLVDLLITQHSDFHRNTYCGVSIGIVITGDRVTVIHFVGIQWFLQQEFVQGSASQCRPLW